MHKHINTLRQRHTDPAIGTHSLTQGHREKDTHTDTQKQTHRHTYTSIGTQTTQNTVTEKDTAQYTGPMLLFMADNQLTNAAFLNYMHINLSITWIGCVLWSQGQLRFSFDRLLLHSLTSNTNMEEGFFWRQWLHWSIPTSEGKLHTLSVKNSRSKNSRLNFWSVENLVNRQ